MKNLVVLLLMLILSTALAAQNNDEPLVLIEIIAGSDSIISNDSFYVAVKLKIKDEWHTYWENPGDGGLKTLFEWTLPSSFSISEPAIPYPKKFLVDDMVNFGYEKEAAYLFKIKTSDVTDFENRVEVKATWLACKEECIPGTSIAAKVFYASKEKVKTNKDNRRIFEQIRTMIPVNADNIKISAFSKNESILFEIVPGGTLKNFSRIDFFPVQQGIFSYASGSKLLMEDGKYLLTVPLDPMRGELPEELDAVFYTPEGWDEAGIYKAIQQKIKLNK